MSQPDDYLHVMSTTTTVPELLEHLCVTQEYNTTSQKYWLLAHSTHADYGIIHNLRGEFVTFKGQLYIPKILVPTILYEYHVAQGHFG